MAHRSGTMLLRYAPRVRLTRPCSVNRSQNFVSPAVRPESPDGEQLPVPRTFRCYDISFKKPNAVGRILIDTKEGAVRLSCFTQKVIL